MKNNIIVLILAVLLIISIGFGVYSFQKSVKLEKLLQTKVQTLEGEKGALQQKLDKGLAYAESLDLLYEPVRKGMGLPTRYNISDVEWVSEFSRVTKAVGDDTLDGLLQEIQAGGSEASMATVRFMERAISGIADSLK